MKRTVVVLAMVAGLAAVGSGVAVWALVRSQPPPGPQISVYSNGHVSRVGPYRYCDVLNLDDCREPQTQGELAVNARDPVQLSVSPEIGRAPWRLLLVYQNRDDTTMTMFRPNSRLAVTIATVDPQRGQLTGVVVQLLTLVVDSGGQVHDVPHAEWSVRMLWN